MPLICDTATNTNQKGQAVHHLQRAERSDRLLHLLPKKLTIMDENAPVDQENVPIPQDPQAVGRHPSRV